MTQLLVREFTLGNDDYGALVEIDTALFPENPTRVEDFRYDDENFDRTRYVLKRYVAQRGAAIVGYGTYHHMPSRFHPQRFWMWIAVHPQHQRQGIGTLLYERLIQDLRHLQALWVGTSCRENMPEALQFLHRRGFEEVLRSWESRLDVDKFNFEPFREYAERLRREGIEVTTLAEEKERNPRWLEQVYELHTTLMADVPSHTPYTPPPLDQFVRYTLAAPGSLPDGFYVAKEGQRYIGESFVTRNLGEPGALYQGLTAVRREYRGRGIALALKLHTIAYAQKHGYKVIKTWNATVNEGMLAINQKLGFVRQPAWIEMEKAF